jgi:hypothetical protein
LGDSAEIKEHPFFQDTNWAAILQKEVKAPPFHPAKKNRRTITQEEMFGNVEESARQQRNLNGWSFIES